MRPIASWPSMVTLILSAAWATACATTLERARTATARGDLDEATSLYREAMDDPEQAAKARQELTGLWVDEARALEKGDPDRAEAIYRDALELEPAHDQALTGLVRVMRRSGRIDDAAAAIEGAAATGACAACLRLGVVVLLERGDRAAAAKQWDVAVKHYGDALALRRQPEPALAIVRAHLGAARGEQAVDALSGAKELMGEADESALRGFFDTRAELVTAALAADDPGLADRARAVVLANEPGNRGVALELLVADHHHAKGNVDEAATRYEALLATHASGRALTDAQREDLVARLVELYGLRATGHLAAGRSAEAEADLGKALELRPDDWEIKLQRVLAMSEKIGAVAALEGLALAPPGTPGIPQVQAILESQRANELAQAGDLEGARAAHERADKIHPDMPEVHLAAAHLLARTAPEDLGKTSVRALAKGGLVAYGGELFRYAESLGELDWARAANKSRAADYPFRAPWFSATADALEQRIRAVYPFAVEFSPDPEPRLRLRNGRADAVALEIEGPDGFRDTFDIDAGDTNEVTLPESGLVRLRIAGKKRTFYAEPYAAVTIEL